MRDSEKNEALVQLAGTMAHELNNIFTAVAGNLSFLESAFDKGDSNSRLVDDVIRTANRGIELSRKLQAFAGRQPLKRVKVDVNQAVILVVAELKKTILRGVDVQLDLTRGECPVSADAEKFRAVVGELADNAAAAMDQRGRLALATACISLKERDVPGLPPGTYVCLTMRDSGRGMNPDVAARALEPFFTTKGGGAGKGWGLSQCAGFVRQCGGRILLSSEPGQGTTINIYLPRHPDSAGGR